MIFAIPSYHRPKCKTVSTLLNAGVEKNSIVISVQDERDFEEYKENFPEMQIIFRKTDCAAGNRNTLLEHIAQRPICLLDDDISSFCYFTDDGRFLARSSYVIKLLSLISGAGGELIGVAPLPNSLTARNRTEWSVDVVLQGSVLIVNSSDLRFDERYKMVEDYEISLRTIYQGKHTLRYNRISATKPKNGTNAGGLHERYMNRELQFYLNVLQKQYPIFKINKNRTGGAVSLNGHKA